LKKGGSLIWKGRPERDDSMDACCSLLSPSRNAIFIRRRMLFLGSASPHLANVSLVDLSALRALAAFHPRVR